MEKKHQKKIISIQLTNNTKDVKDSLMTTLQYIMKSVKAKDDE